MNFADQPSRAAALVFIVAAHAAAIFGLAQLQPHRATVDSAQPIVVRFIASSQPKQTPPRPKPRIIPVELPAPAKIPDLPLIEFAAAAPAQRAISVPMQVAATPPAPPQDRSIPKLVSAVEYLREPIPHYPSQSRRLREQGLVVLRVVIDERGKACEIHVESSSGYVRLDHAAREAVQRAAFRPYVEDGAPRRALVLIPIEFALNRSAV